MTHRKELANTVDNIPDSLKKLRRWVVFKIGRQGNKLKKFPINARTFEPAKSNCPEDWSSFGVVRSLVVKSKYQAVAFALVPDDGFVGFDFDNCVDSECQVHKAVVNVLDELNTYTESSISGNGVRAIVRGQLRGTRSTTKKTPWGDEFAMFDCGKFLIFTGNRFPDSPSTVNEIADLSDIYDRFFPSSVDLDACKQQLAKSKPLDISDRVRFCLAEMLSMKLADGNDGSRRLFVLGCRAIEWSITKGEFRLLIRFIQSIQPWPNTWTDDEIDKRYVDAASRDDVIAGIKASDLVLDPHEPLRIAEAVVRQEFDHEDHHRIIRYQGDYWLFKDGIYQQTSHESVRDTVYRFCDPRFVQCKDELLPFGPDKHKVSQIEDALRSVAFLSNEVSPPCWLKTPEGFSDSETLIVHSEGITDIESGATTSLTPSLFSMSRLNYPFDPRAGKDALIVQLLNEQYFPGDPEQVELIQMFAGYCLTAAADLDRILYLYGPSRSGKGTICNVLSQLVGRDNSTSMRLGELAGRFGLETLVHRKLMFVRDARLNRRDQTDALERLLLLSGGDPVTIDRKGRAAVERRLRIKIVIASNELIRVTDHAQALASRLLIVKLQHSFKDKEDDTVRRRVVDPEEMTKALNWAIEGYMKLKAIGRFTSTDASREMLEAFTSQASPIVSFLRDRCEFGPKFSISIKNLYLKFCMYCTVNGINHPPAAQQFGVEFRTAWTAVAPEGLLFKKTRPASENPKRKEHYAGLRICQSIKASQKRHDGQDEGSGLGLITT